MTSPKLPKAALAQFKAWGAKGGKARAARLTDKALSDIGKLGGRPKGAKKKVPKRA